MAAILVVPMSSPTISSSRFAICAIASKLSNDAIDRGLCFGVLGSYANATTR
jgi:hypothetical protein